MYVIDVDERKVNGGLARGGEVGVSMCGWCCTCCVCGPSQYMYCGVGS